MKHATIAFLGIVLACAAADPAISQPQAEGVVATAPKRLGDDPKNVIGQFVQSYLKSATLSDGKIAQWKSGICARTYGLSQDQYNQFVTDRVENTAAEVGINLQPSPCRLNVEIIFTDKPQDFLSRVNGLGARLLGATLSQSDAAQNMRYPVQAWYNTATRDNNGSLIQDNQDSPVPTTTANSVLQNFNSANFASSTGSRITNGQSSELSHIYVVADTNKTQEFSLGAIADYITVLIFSQSQDFDNCKAIPSIANLVSPLCNADLKPKGMTDADLAYLKAIYRTNSDTGIQKQGIFITNQIVDSQSLK